MEPVAYGALVGFVAIAGWMQQRQTNYHSPLELWVSGTIGGICGAIVAYIITTGSTQILPAVFITKYPTW